MHAPAISHGRSAERQDTPVGRIADDQRRGAVDDTLRRNRVAGAACGDQIVERLGMRRQPRLDRFGRGFAQPTVGISREVKRDVRVVHGLVPPVAVKRAETAPEGGQIGRFHVPRFAHGYLLLNLGMIAPIHPRPTPDFAGFSGAKCSRSFSIALWWVLRIVCGSTLRALATSATSMSRSYSMVRISFCRGDNRPSGSLIRSIGSAVTASADSGTAS